MNAKEMTIWQWVGGLAIAMAISTLYLAYSFPMTAKADNTLTMGHCAGYTAGDNVGNITVPTVAASSTTSGGLDITFNNGTSTSPHMFVFTWYALDSSCNQEPSGSTAYLGDSGRVTFSTTATYTFTVTPNNSDGTELDLNIYNGTTLVTTASNFATSDTGEVMIGISDLFSTSAHAPSVALPFPVPEIVPPYTTDVDITASSPYNGLSLPDFQNFVVNVQPETAHTGNGTISADYWNDSNQSGTETVDYYQFTWLPMSGQQQDYYQYNVPKSVSLSPGSYHVVYTLYSADTNDNAALGRTSYVSFTVTAGQQTDVPPPPAIITPTTPVCSTTDTSLLGNINTGFCKAFNFLFTPSAGTLNQFNNLPNKFQTVAPFSYFYEIYSVFFNIPTSGDTTMATLTLTTGTATGVNITWDMFSPTTVEKYTSAPVRSALRSIVLVSLSLSFLYMVFTQTRHLFKH